MGGVVPGLITGWEVDGTCPPLSGRDRLQLRAFARFALSSVRATEPVENREAYLRALTPS
ncbi:MAG TPA: hypothetical protein VHJ54_01220 [Solirubrobacterales bacterium]|nr:hypothetical protein [Solirubrobacterales bacterium]